MESTHPLNDGVHTYIRLKTLEIDKKYPICGFGVFERKVDNIDRKCPTVKIDSRII